MLRAVIFHVECLFSQSIQARAREMGDSPNVARDR